MANKKKLPPGVRGRDGRFTYRYSVEVIVNGEKKRKQKETRSFPTAKEAYDHGIQIEASRQKGRLVDEKNITLGQWKEIWIEDYELEREPSLNTIRNREVGLRSLERHLGEHTRVKDVTSQDYQQYLNQLKRNKIKKGTIQQYHAAAHLFFSDAVKKKIIAEDPTQEATIPVFKKTLQEIESGGGEIPKFLEKKQLQHLLQLMRFRGKPQEYAIFLTLAYTGLRIGELLALKTTDFNEEQKTLSITKTLTVLTSIEKYKLGPPKNKSSIRKVSIGDSVIKVLKSQIAWRNERIANMEARHDADFIFWSVLKPGFPASCIHLETRFKDFLEIAHLPETLTPHSLRHTHVSLLAEAGEELAVIQERLGHKNDEITKRVYLHVTKDQRAAVPDRFEQLMSI